MFYDVKFGRRKTTEEKDDTAIGQAAGNSSSVTIGNGHVKKTPELAIYEQYRNQVVYAILIEWCG